MKQISDAKELVQALRRGRVPDGFNGAPYALWAPGDSTLYQVSLVTLWPAERESELPTHRLLHFSVAADTLTLSGSLAPWTTALFVERFDTRFMGWWPGLRPVLAALAWTTEDDRDTRYNPVDWPMTLWHDDAAVMPERV